MARMPAFFNRLSISWQAILLTCLGYSIFSVADTIAKYLRDDYSVDHILAYSSGVAWILTGLYIIKRYGWNGFKPASLKFHLWRACILALTAHIVVYAFGQVPLAEFYGISFISPFLVAILAYLFLKEPIKRYQMVAIAGGFSGVLVLVVPQFSTFSTDLLLIVLSTTLFSINLLLIRKIGTQDLKVLFPFFTFGGIFISSVVFIFDDPFSMPLIDAGVFFIYGIVLVFAQLCLSTGFALAPSAGTVAPFHYIQIIWGVIFGYFIFDDVPSFTTLVGAGIIIAAGLYMIMRERNPTSPILVEDTSHPL